jgi:glycosyltransferase involved in cell wall biosynthesis
MRFLLLTTFYPPWNFGGDGIFVQQLAKSLVEDGHHVEVVHCVDSHRMLTSSSEIQASCETPGVIVHSLRSPFGSLSPLLTHQTGYPFLKSDKLRSILKRGFDVVHFHNASLLGPKSFELVPKQSDCISLYTSHELWLVCQNHTLWKNDAEICERPSCISCSLRYRRPPQWWRFTGLLEKASLHIDQFIAPSEFVAETLRQRGFKPEVEYLPNFVDPGIFAGSSDDESPRSHRTSMPYVLYAGRLESIKGVDRAIKAWVDIKDTDLVIAGSGAQSSELEQLASSNPRVRFLGKIPRSELGPWWSGAIASIVPSIGYENCPLSVIESFACKTPVIGHDLAGVRELIQKSGGGLLYKTEDQIRTAITWLKNDEVLRSQLSQNAYDAWKRLWSTRSHLERYYEIIDRTKIAKKNKQPYG